MSDLMLEGVGKSFGDTVAVAELSFRVGQGELVAILGPSGCGKTTTLRMIAGFERPDRGRILIDGYDVTDAPPQRRDIGVVFQSYALFPHMTVAQNVAFGLEMRRMARVEIDKAIAAVLALVRLDQLGARYPHQLSGGQQQRVALARALAIRPRLLLLDEPLSNLDAKLRDDMREEIRRIQREVGITAVFVTHDQAEAFALADRIAVMDHGRLQQIADPESVYRRPANATVGSFIGQTNVWDGSVVAVEGDRVRVRLAGGLEIVATGTGLTAGQACRVFVKHEAIALSHERPESADNCVAGRVTGRTFLGGSTSYAVTATDALALEAVVPNRAGFEQFQPGEEVFAAWSTTACQVFCA